MNKQVSGAYNQTVVYDILQQLFGSKIQYVEKGNYIILLPKQESESTVNGYYYIDGYVIDGITGERIPEVSIYDPNLKVSTISSKFGYYFLKLKKDKEVTLIINKRTYQDTIIYLGSKENVTLNITIFPSAKPELNEVNDSNRNDTIQLSKPFVEFIINKEQKTHIQNIRYTINRKFQVSFLLFLVRMVC